jgi:glycosyltransferase involved in cell wall biosynthesis
MSRPAVTKVMVFPRDRNPYQNLLYTGLAGAGIEAVYIGVLTSSQTLNIALLPFEVVARRLGGNRLLHIHWIFSFALPVVGGFRAVRWLSQCWFRLFLLAARCCGVHVVWTVHNVLPHERVFFDDVVARRFLVRSCSLVVAHSDHALDEVTRRFGAPRAGIVLPHGTYATASAPTHSTARRPRRFAFVGKITRYKGVGDLLTAFKAAGLGACADLTIAGACQDPAMAGELEIQGAAVGATLRLEYLTDQNLNRLLSETDFVALPMRGVTTSGTLVLALAAGAPIIVPDSVIVQPEPAGAVIRYDGSITGLTRALRRAASMPDEELAAMRSAAHRWAAGTPSWHQIGDALARALKALADGDDPVAAGRLTSQSERPR